MSKQQIPKRYPYTYVEFIDIGIAVVYFYDKKVSLHIEKDILDPVLDKYPNLRAIADKETLYNCIATNFTTLPNNKPEYLNGYIGIDCKYYKNSKPNSAELNWMEFENSKVKNEPTPYIIKGVNSDENTTIHVEYVNDKLRLCKQSIENYLVKLDSTSIKQKKVNELNS